MMAELSDVFYLNCETKKQEEFRFCKSCGTQL